MSLILLEMRTGILVMMELEVEAELDIIIILQAVQKVEVLKLEEQAIRSKLIWIRLIINIRTERIVIHQIHLLITGAKVTIA